MGEPAVRVHAATDVEQYAEAVVEFLEEDPCARNVLRTVIDTARRGGTTWTDEPRFWWASRGAETVGAAHWTPPYGLLVSLLPQAAIDPLVVAVHGDALRRGLRMPTIAGPRPVADAVAGAWTRHTGEPHVVHRRMLLSELGDLTTPRRPDGAARPAGVADTDLVVGWWTAFATETGQAHAAPNPRAAVDRIVQSGTAYLWDDGGPVSLVAHTAPAAGVVRVGPVYTPPERRGRGYARALTAHVSRTVLDAGAQRCMLYTDAANPVSNAIYRQIGYVPTGEHAEYALG